MRAARKAALLHDIERSFPVAPIPSLDEIAHPDDLEGERLRELLAGMSWKEVPAGIAYRCQGSIPNFAPIGFRYYLPVFLIAALEHDEWDVIDYVRSSLTPPDTLKRDFMQRCFLARVGGLDERQRRVICRFFEYMLEGADEIEARDLEKPLSRYWRAAAAGRPPGVDDLIPPPGEGVSWVRMPNVTGCGFDQAVVILRESGVTQEITRTDVDWLEPHLAGRVCRTNPDPDDVAQFRHGITLYVQHRPALLNPAPRATRKEALLRDIESAFPVTPLPSRDEIAAPGDEGGAILRESLAQRSWKEVRADDAYRWQSALPHFAPVGLRYYLPVFLVAALEHEDRDVIDHLAALLTPPDTLDPIVMQRWLRARGEAFDEPQRCAIRRFLEYMLEGAGKMDAPSLEKPLRRYWRRAASAWPPAFYELIAPAGEDKS